MLHNGFECVFVVLLRPAAATLATSQVAVQNNAGKASKRHACNVPIPLQSALRVHELERLGTADSHSVLNANMLTATNTHKGAKA